MAKFFGFMLLIFTSVSLASPIETAGPWYQGRDYNYHYISVYSVKTLSKPLSNFPWIEQDCHDESDRMAMWKQTITYEIVFKGVLDFKVLGFGIDLGSERKKNVQFSFERWIKATGHLKARHTLHEQFDVYEGYTQKEVVYPDGKVELVGKKYPFVLSGTNYGLTVKREIIERCEGL